MRLTLLSTMCQLYRSVQLLVEESGVLREMLKVYTFVWIYVDRNN